MKSSCAPHTFFPSYILPQPRFIESCSTFPSTTTKYELIIQDINHGPVLRKKTDLSEDSNSSLSRQNTSLSRSSTTSTSASTDKNDKDKNDKDKNDKDKNDKDKNDKDKNDKDKNDKDKNDKDKNDKDKNGTDNSSKSSDPFKKFSNMLVRVTETSRDACDISTLREQVIGTLCALELF
jgi:hypothetical protein